MTEKDMIIKDFRTRIENFRKNYEPDSGTYLQETLVDFCEKEYKKEPTWENARVLIEEYVRLGVFSDEIKRRNDMRRALKNAEELCSRFPEADSGIYEKQAGAYFVMKNYEKAAELYIKAAELCNDTEAEAGFYIKAAGSYREDFCPGKAELYIDKAAELEVSPTIHGIICKEKGSLLHSLKKYKEAYTYLMKAPEDVLTCLMLADSIKNAPLPEYDFHFYEDKAEKLAEKSDDVRLKMISEGYMYFMSLYDENYDAAEVHLVSALLAAKNARSYNVSEQIIVSFLYGQAEDFYKKTNEAGKLKKIRKKREYLPIPDFYIKADENYLLHPDIIGDNPESLYKTGLVYADKDTVFYRNDRALRLISLAAQKGSSEAEKTLPLIYADGEEYETAGRLCARYTERYRKDKSPEGRKLLAEGYEIWGDALLKENSFYRCLVCYLTAIEIRKQNLKQDMSIENKRLLSESYNKRGCCHMHWESEGQAEMCFREDLRLFEDVCAADPSFDNLFELARKYMCLGHTICTGYLKEEALPFYLKAIGLKDRILSFPELPGYVMVHYAYAYRMTGDLYKYLYKDREKAVLYYTEYYKITMAGDDIEDKAICCRHFAECFMYFKDWSNAEKYMLQSIRLTENNKGTSDFDIETRYRKMSTIYEELGDSEKAAYYYKKGNM